MEVEVDGDGEVDVGSAGSVLDVGSIVVGSTDAGSSVQDAPTTARGCGEGERPIRLPRRECAVHDVPFEMVS